MVEEVEKVKGNQKNKFSLKKHLAKFKWFYAVTITVVVALGGYLGWLNNYVSKNVADSRYFEFTKPSIPIKEFVGTDANVKKIERSLFVASIFKPNYAKGGYYIQKEIGLVGIAYEEDGKMMDYGNMINDRFTPLDVKVINKNDFDTKAPDFEIFSKKEYVKLDDVKVVQDYLRQIGVPYDSGKTYYKFVAGKSYEKYAILVGKNIFEGNK